MSERDEVSDAQSAPDRGTAVSSCTTSGDRGSVVKRVTQSARQVFKSALEPSSVTNDLASRLPSAEKGESSSNARITVHSDISDCTGTASTAAYEPGPFSGKQTIRLSGDVTALQQQRDFESFLTDSVHENGTPEEENIAQTPSPFSSSQSHSASGLSSNPAIGFDHDPNVIASSDGAAVVELLSSKQSFLDEDFESPDPEDEQFRILEKDPLELSQDHVESSAKQFDLLPLSQSRAPASCGEGESNVSYSLSEADSANIDIQPWLEILDSYQDEVWGDALPLVEAARLEVSNAATSGTLNPTILQTSPAFQRLKMLLGHIEQLR